MTDGMDMRELWNEYARRVDASLERSAAALTLREGERIRRGLRPWIVGSWIEIVANAVALLFLGSFTADAIGRPAVAAAGAFLFVCAWVLGALEVRQLVAIARVDFGAPILCLQANLERWRIRRVRKVYWTFVVSPLIWVALLVVIAQLAGIDAYAALPWFLLANLAFAIGVLATGIILAKRATSTSWIGNLLAGRTLAAELERFEAIRAFANA